MTGKITCDELFKHKVKGAIFTFFLYNNRHNNEIYIVFVFKTKSVIVLALQGISGIDDVAEAIFHLEESNWDLIVSNSCYNPLF